MRTVRFPRTRHVTRDRARTWCAPLRTTGNTHPSPYWAALHTPTTKQRTATTRTGTRTPRCSAAHPTKGSWSRAVVNTAQIGICPGTINLDTVLRSVVTVRSRKHPAPVPRPV